MKMKVKVLKTLSHENDHIPSNTINDVDKEPNIKNKDKTLSEPIDFFSLIFNDNLCEELTEKDSFYYEGTKEEKYEKKLEIKSFFTK